MKVGGYGIGSVLALIVILLAVLGIIGVSLPAQAIWFAILILAIAVFLP